jgi:hypothetical protein
MNLVTISWGSEQYINSDEQQGSCRFITPHIRIAFTKEEQEQRIKVREKEQILAGVVLLGKLRTSL